MAIIHTRHAEEKRKQRGIDKGKVEETIADPDTVTEARSDRKAAYKNYGNLHLKVVFVEESDNAVVITQHWTDVVK